MPSNKITILVFVVVMAGLIGGIVFMSTHPRTNSQTQITSSQQPINQNILPSKIPTISVQQSSPIIQNGTNDQQLQQDTQSIDNNLTTLNNELGNIDNGLNDQQINLQ